MSLEMKKKFGVKMSLISCVFLILGGVVFPYEVLADTIGYTTSNAIRDNTKADGVPDELAPYARNYVVNNGWVGVPEEYTWESRTFVEFNLSKASKYFNYAELLFSVFRYNTPHMPDQIIKVNSYQGNGIIELNDWFAASNFVGVTEQIKGFSDDTTNRGDRIDFSIDITASLLSAFDSGYLYYGVSFSNPNTTFVDSRDPLGYGSLLTVGNYQISTEYIAPVPEPTTMLLFGTGIIGLAGSRVRRRKKS